jgi:hypothetical protein
LLTGAPDPQRDARLLYRLRLAERVLELVVAPLERRTVLGPEALQDLHRLPEHPDPPAHAREGHAVLAVLLLVPCGADAELELAARDVVDRRGDIRQQRRVAIGVTDDEDAAADARGVRGERREQREPLEARPLRIRLDRQEVVEDRAQSKPSSSAVFHSSR